MRIAVKRRGELFMFIIFKNFLSMNDTSSVDFLNIEVGECPLASDFHKVCRVCLSQCSLRSIFKYKDALRRTPQDLSGKFRKCSGIKVKCGDGLPDKICSRCVRLLELACHFRTLSGDADKKLRDASKRKKRFHANEKEADDKEALEDVKSEVNTDCEDDAKTEKISTQKPANEDELYLFPISKKEEHCIVKNEDVVDTDYDFEFGDDSGEEKFTEDKGERAGENLRTGKRKRFTKNKDGDELKNPDTSFNDLTFYGCLLCEKRLPCKDSLVTHMAERHGDVTQEEYRCYWCEEVFDTRRLRLRHERKHCPKTPPGSTYRCRKCPAELRNRSALEGHMSQHDGAACNTVELGQLFACPVCRKTLSNKGSLLTHMRLVHTQSAGIPCPICNKTMKSEYSLHSHMRTHGERVHACDQCPYRTNLPQSLMLHKRKHSGERPYACEWCTHRSVNISNLNKHHLIHTGVRKHECAECGKKYKAKKTLVSHISSFHRGLRPFCCDKCGNKYARHKTLRAHEKKAHPDAAIQAVSAK